MSAEALKILFMGSPEIAVPSLQRLLETKDRVIGVVTQPDRPAGRGREMKPPAVASFAREKGLPLLQPERIKNNVDFLDTLRRLAPDLIAIVAYGKILPREILGLPPRGCINVHFSLLPKYRGAAPLQWALINGEAETGVTTFLLNEGVDSGPIFLQKKVPVHDEDNAAILGHRLSIIGAHLLSETIEGMKSGEIEPIPQDDRKATLAPLLQKEDGKIDWGMKAKLILGKIRGMNPWPGTFTSWKEKRLKIHSAEVVVAKRQGAPGEILEAIEDGLEIACGQGTLLVKEVQMEGGKRLTVSDFLKGHSIAVGEKLGSQEGTASP